MHKTILKIGGILLVVQLTTAAVNLDGKYTWAFAHPDGWPAGYNDKGVPLDVVQAAADYDNAFFDRVGASFAEADDSPDKKIQTMDPDLLLGDGNSSLLLGDCAAPGCRITVTFLHDGNGDKSSIGYYLFDPQNPPQDTTQVGQEIIFFPNTKVDKPENIHVGDRLTLGPFASNAQNPLGIGFIFIRDKYSGDEGVKDNPSEDRVFYSHRDLNMDEDKQSPSLSYLRKQHMAIVYDAQLATFVLGIEDEERTIKEDGDLEKKNDDFNDVIIALSVDQPNAIDQAAYPAMVDPQDSDGDGISDSQDAFPADPLRAFVSYLQPYSLAFEDRWPSEGDYDMNDLVVEELIRVHRNAEGDLLDIILLQDFVARGAIQDNGFYLQLLGIDAASLLEAVQIDLAQASELALDALELDVYFDHAAAQSLITDMETHSAGLVLKLQEDLKSLLPQDSQQCLGFANTDTNCASTPARRFLVALRLDQAVPTSNGVLAFFNPFLTAQRSRGREIHIIDMPPTELADPSLFGQSDDHSDSGAGRYYRTQGNLPWAIRVAWNVGNADVLGAFNAKTFRWLWPRERETIFSAYPQMPYWASSGGTDFTDWYSIQNATLDAVFQLSE